MLTVCPFSDSCRRRCSLSAFAIFMTGVEVKDTVGTALSTVTAALGPAPASVLPAASTDCAAATDIVNEPLPEHPDTATEGVVVPPLLRFYRTTGTPPVPVTVCRRRVNGRGGRHFVGQYKGGSSAGIDQCIVWCPYRYRGRTVSLTTVVESRSVFPATSEWPAVTLIPGPSVTPLTFIPDAVKVPPLQDGDESGVPFTLTITIRLFSEQVPDTE